MLKSNKIVIQLAVAFVVLAFLLTLHVTEYHQKYVEQWMIYKLRNQDVVIALSTTPYRIEKIQHTLELLYSQNIPIKAIYLSIPYVFKRDNIEYKIPDWLLNDKRITILRTQDYGPATKLLGVLKNAALDKDTIIVTVDDDISYPSNLILHLAYRAKYNPNAAIGLSGINIDYKSITKDGLINVNNTDVAVSALQGVAGIAYRKYFFENSVYDIINSPRECINSDDLYMAFYLATKNIPRVTFKSKYIKVSDISIDEVGIKSDALHQQYPSELIRHKTCLDFLNKSYPGVVF